MTKQNKAKKLTYSDFLKAFGAYIQIFEKETVDDAQADLLVSMLRDFTNFLETEEVLFHSFDVLTDGCLLITRAEITQQSIRAFKSVDREKTKKRSEQRLIILKQLEELNNIFTGLKSCYIETPV
jgi:hypothetical protein